MEILIKRATLVSFTADFAVDTTIVLPWLKRVGCDSIRMLIDKGTVRMETIFPTAHDRTLDPISVSRTFKAVEGSSIMWPKVPMLTLASEIYVPCGKLQDVVSMMAKSEVSDHIDLGIKSGEDATYLSVGMLDTRKEKDTVKEAVSAKIWVNKIDQKDVESLYPFDYFSETFKVVSRKTLINIKMDIDYPFEASYTENGVQVRKFLAPRIEND